MKNYLRAIWLALRIWNTYKPLVMRDWRRYCRDSSYYPGYDPIPISLKDAWYLAKGVWLT